MQGFNIELFNGQIKVINSVMQKIYLTRIYNRISYIFDFATPIEKMSSANMYFALSTALQSSHIPFQKHVS